MANALRKSSSSLLMALVVFLSISSHGVAQQASELADYCRQHSGRTAYGIYLLNKKLGWMVEELRLVKHDGRTVAAVESSGELRISFFGENKTMKIEARRLYELTGDGRLLFAYDKMSEGPDDVTEYTARRTTTGMVVDMLVENQRRKVRTRSTKESLRQMIGLSSWLSAQRKPGDTFRQRTLDFELISESGEKDSEIDPDELETLTFQGQRQGRLAGVSVKLALVKSQSPSLSADFELLPDGKPFKFQMGPMEVRLEEEAIAKDVDTVVGDILASVNIDRHLGETRDIARLVVELTGLGDFEVPSTGRQKVLSSKGGTTILDIEQGRRSGDEQPLDGSKKTEYTKPTVRVQSDHETVLSLARKIVGDETARAKRCALLQEWIFDNLETSYRHNAETSLRVLENRAGDCTEHALLFVSFARALQIPAREVSGLIYVKEGKPAFHWHAWAEFHNGSRWISVDPAWNEVDVDASHIKMGDGPHDFRWIEVLGRLKIAVREVSTTARAN